MEAWLSSLSFFSLNLIGRLLLINFILQSMSSYLLWILDYPKKSLNEIWSIQRTFLFGSQKGKNKKWALVSSGKVCKPKFLGGLGLRDPKIENKVMYTTLCWKWLFNSKYLWSHIWKRKYEHNITTQELICLQETTTMDKWYGMQPGKIKESSNNIIFGKLEMAKQIFFGMMPGRHAVN